jgi:hypothetical protein
MKTKNITINKGKCHIAWCLFAVIAISVFSSCENDLKKYQIQEGTPPVLSISENSPIILTSEDSATAVLSLSWTDPGYFSEDTKGNVVGNYFLEIGANNTFSNKTSISLGNISDTTLTCYVLNLKLISLGFETGTPADVCFRIKSVFFNKDTLYSNIGTVNITPYSIVPPPAIAVPDELYITGNAIPAGWVTPFPANQKFTRVGNTTFTLTIELYGNSEYELITDVNGSNWTPCYRLAPGTVQADVAYGGSFVWDGNGSDYNWSSLKFLTPPDDATYTLTFDFQNATFTVANATAPPAIAVPAELYITGNAIPAGWAVPFPANQKFTKVDNTTFALTISLYGNSEYELVTDVTGANWTPCYRLAPDVVPADHAYGGTFVWDGNGSSYNWTTLKFLTPPGDDTYILTFNFQSATYTVVRDVK